MKIFIIFLLIFNKSFAEYKCLNKKELKTNTIYINGFDNDFNDPETIKKVSRISNFLKKASISIDEGYFIRNQTKGFMADLAMAYEQKTNEANRHFKTINKINFFKTILASPINFISSQYKNDNSDQITKELKQYILTGNKIIVVSHSQGNLYANEACISLKQDSNLDQYLKDPYPFVNIQVATPSSVIECADNGQNYVSLDKDAMISRLTAGAYASKVYVATNAVASPLKPNLVVKNFISKDPEDENRYHNMLSVYLAYPESQKKIFKLISESDKKFDFHGMNEEILSAKTEDGARINKKAINQKTDQFLSLKCKDLAEGIMSFPMTINSNSKFTNFKVEIKQRDQKEIESFYMLPSSTPIIIENTYNSETGFKTTLKSPDHSFEPTFLDSLKDTLKGLFIFIGTILFLAFGPKLSNKSKEDEEEEERRKSS